MFLTKSQGWVFLLRYKHNLLKPSRLQHVIKSQGMKSTSLKASIHYQPVRHNRVLLYCELLLFHVMQWLMHIVSIEIKSRSFTQMYFDE